MRPETNPTAVTGAPRTWLRLEGLAVFAASVLFYRWQLESWTTFLVFFFAPDVGIVGYLGGSRLGARLYNLAHNYVAPIFLVCWSLAIGRQDVVPWALIWTGHIGFDRMLGFGLKHPTGFRDTHLGRLHGLARLRPRS